MGGKPTWIPTWQWIMFLGQPDFASSSPQRDGSDRKLGAHNTPKFHNPLMCRRAHMIGRICLHTTPEACDNTKSNYILHGTALSFMVMVHGPYNDLSLQT